MEEKTKSSSKRKGTPYRVYLIAVIAILALGAGGYYGYGYWKAKQNSPEAQAAAADAEKQDVLKKLSKLMVIPEGDPVLFKVSDQEQMRKQQAFFKDTVNDDVLLVFQASSKAIIYRPSTNVIINVGPINFDQTKDTAATPKTPVTTESDTAKTTTTTKK